MLFNSSHVFAQHEAVSCDAACPLLFNPLFDIRFKRIEKGLAPLWRFPHLPSNLANKEALNECLFPPSFTPEPPPPAASTSPAPSVAIGCKKLAASFKLFRDGCKSASVAFCWLDALPRQTDPQLIHITRNDDADFWKRPLILPGQTKLNGDTPTLTESCEGSEVPAYMSVHIYICMLTPASSWTLSVSQATSRKKPNFTWLSV